MPTYCSVAEGSSSVRRVPAIQTQRRYGPQRAIWSPAPLKRRPSPTHLLPRPAPQTQAEQANPAKCQPPRPGHLPLPINLTFHNSYPQRSRRPLRRVYSAAWPPTRHMRRSHQTRGVCPRQQPRGLPASTATPYQTSSHFPNSRSDTDEHNGSFVLLGLNHRVAQER